MVASSRRPSRPWRLIAQAALIGAALGTIGMAGGGLFLQDAHGTLAASTGVVLTLLAALAAGLWAAAPDAALPEPPLRGRWFAAGLISGGAGVFATLWAAYPALRDGVLGRILALLILLAAPVYVLGLLLPLLLAWAERKLELDAEGSAPEPEPLGTLLIPLLGGMMAGVAVTGLVLVPWAGPGPVLLGMGAALILPTILGEEAPHGSREKILFETQSAVSQIRVVEVTYPGQRQPERRLYVNEEEESGELVRSGAPTLPYIAAAEQWLAETASRGDRYLFLGGGAYTLPRRVAERDPRARITVVELDPEVTRVAYRFFGMRRHYGIHSVHGDARAFLDRVTPASYDRLFVDVYAGQESLPYSLITLEASTLAARSLRAGGMLTINAIGVGKGPASRPLWSLVRTVAEVFPALALYTHLGPDYPERQNFLLAATNQAQYEFPARAGLFDVWPAGDWPAVDGTIVYHDVEPGASDAEPTERAAANRPTGRHTSSG